MIVPSVPQPGSTSRFHGLTIGLVAGIAAALSTSLILAAVVALGRSIPTADVSADYVKGVLWAAALGASILFWPVQRDERRVLIALWGLRCAVTLGLMLWYEGHYSVLDAYEYFAVSQRQPLGYEGASWSGTQLVERFTTLHARWLVSSYHAMKVSMSMMGLIATYLFYRAATVATGRRRLSVLVGLSCIPSILFWSSILGKDPIVVLGIAAYSLGTVIWLRQRRLRGLVVALAGVLLVSAVRLWLAPVLLLPMLVVAAWDLPGVTRRLLFIAAGGAALAAALTLLRDYFALSVISEAVEVLAQSSQAWAGGGSGQQLGADLTDPVQLIKFLPVGIFTALFRPVPGEVMNAFGLLAGLENLAVLALLIVALWRMRGRTLKDPIVVWALLLVLLWAAVYAPVSYQNLGTAARFRLQVLPLLVLLLAHLGRLGQPGTRVTPAPTA
ncbi:MAG: hypothetical protein ACT4R6_00715 [Gemmatimonadaceae bacterium]